MKRTLTLIFLSIILISCTSLTGEEVARLKLDKVTTSEENVFEKETTLELKKDDELMFWSDMDIEYTGEAYFQFRFRIYKNGEPYGILEIDPTEKNITIGEIKTVLNDNTKWSFTGKNKELKIKESGKYKIKCVLKTTSNPSIKINKAEVVIKQ